LSIGNFGLEGECKKQMNFNGLRKRVGNYVWEDPEANKNLGSGNFNVGCNEIGTDWKI
jgi:hypothetical protein